MVRRIYSHGLRKKVFGVFSPRVVTKLKPVMDIVGIILLPHEMSAFLPVMRALHSTTNVGDVGEINARLILLFTVDNIRFRCYRKVQWRLGRTPWDSSCFFSRN